MGGVRNGPSDSEPGDPSARQETFAVKVLAPPIVGDVHEQVEQHLQVASRLLGERQAPKAFGELVRASRSLPMTPRLAAALVTVSLRAGTEAAAITLLSASLGKVDGAVRRHVHRQLARVLRRVDQLPRAIEALEAAVAAFPEDQGFRRVLHVLLLRTGKWEALVASLEREAQEAFQRGAYSRAARATRWRARVQAEKMRNLARASEGYGQAANYLEQMGDALGAFAMRLDGLRVLHASGASEAVIAAASSVCMSAAARLGREAQARQVLEELGLVASPIEAAASEPASAAKSSPPEDWTAGAEARAPGNESDAEAWAAEPESWVAESEALPIRIAAPVAEPAAPAAAPAPPSVAPEAQAAEPNAQAVAPEAPAAESVAPAAKPESVAAEPAAQASEPEARTARPAATIEMSLPLLNAMLAASSGSDAKATLADAPVEPTAPEAEVSPPVAAPPESARPSSESSETRAEGGAVPNELPRIPDEGASRSEPPVAAAQTTAPVEPEVGSEEPSTEPEMAAPSASQLWADPAAQQRLEAQLIARKAWQELAHFYLTRADRSTDPGLRAEALTRLAELMENELSDPSGAARIYREIVALTGDRQALREQVRLLSQRGDPSLVRRALDEAVQSARTPEARAAAYLIRAERSLETGERSRAKADFETAEALTPGMLLVLAGLVRCVPKAEGPLMAHRLRAALAAAPRRSPDRLEALRVLASFAEDSLKDLRMAQWAWAEVLAEEPAESKARERLLELARGLGDRPALSQLLREQLAREPRGPAARLARLELVTALENLGDSATALTELRQAVRFEPGHKEAWLLLADRLAARGQIGEAAWALEHAATAMEDEAERQRAWVRLATFCRDVLKDPARAEMYARRAESMRLALKEKSEPPVPSPPRSAIPPRREGGTRPKVLVPVPGNVNLTPVGKPFTAEEAETATDIHPPPPPVDTSSRPTIELSAVGSPVDKLPFAEDETTANDGPEGFVPPGELPPPEKPPVSQPAPQALDPSKELDALLGEDKEAPVEAPIEAPVKKQESANREESDHTSPSLSAWALKRPAALPRSRKASAPAPSSAPAKEKSSPEKAEKPAPRMRKSRSGVREERAQPAIPEQLAPPAPEPRVKEETAPGRRTAPKAALPREAAADRAQAASPGTTGTRPTLAEVPARPSALTPLPRTKRPESSESAFAQISTQGTDSKKRSPVQNTSFISWVAPPGKMEPVRRVVRTRGTGNRPALPPEPPEAEPEVFKKVRERPLDAGLYLQIAEYFQSRADKERAALMKEIADAIEGREGPPARAPRTPLSQEERSGLRHPLLRSPAGELLTCVGGALCRLFPTHGRAAGTRDVLHPGLGKGAAASLEALTMAQHLLGIAAPEVVLSEDNGPPFALVFSSAPRMLVGKQAVRQVLPAAELRFYAGRALLCLGPDLLALRSLKKDQILRGLALLPAALKEGQPSSLEARVLRESLSARQLEKAAALYGPATRQFDVSALADAARDSANRAGLIACGAVGPALAALQMKRALEREVVELVRFAASERYFQIRTTH
jgi:tetratricopeptide (TPR) repeat protein